MAFAAAAEVGAQTKAELLLADFEAAPAALPRYMRSLAAMAVVYGKARLGNYPGAIAELKRLAHPDPDVVTPGLELDALAFCLALGDTDSAPRLLELRAGLEGPRPAAICAYAAAISTDNAADHLEAAKTCEAAELWTFAAACRRRRGARLPGRGRHLEGAHGKLPAEAVPGPGRRPPR